MFTTITLTIIILCYKILIVVNVISVLIVKLISKSIILFTNQLALFCFNDLMNLNIPLVLFDFSSNFENDHAKVILFIHLVLSYPLIR